MNNASMTNETKFRIVKKIHGIQIALKLQFCWIYIFDSHQEMNEIMITIYLHRAKLIIKINYLIIKTVKKSGA